ncbi:histone acetyltransferase type B catalytic subunit [Impatiens glandulifera]|uniref:histone acetyltransferase type B catalytic subunit n=1 Tax=Impatiens glandulifera TaxID=253017 RepID=UPI001FB0DD19|nr:histone acetyltransferase type B catalytic subunit [Impatiens glandulifera]
MGTKNSSSDLVSESRKRRCIKDPVVDSGVVPDECIKIYLVSSKEEVDSVDISPLQDLDLNQFFEEDDKIYGYTELKITIWVSTISFHAYADISFQKKSDGGKGITDLKFCLQKIFGENLIDNKDDFNQTFSTEIGFVKSVVSNGEVLKQNSHGAHGSKKSVSEGDLSDVEVIRIVDIMSVGTLYSRLVPFVLLLIDGSNPIDITDPCWEIFVIVKKKRDEEVDNHVQLLGLAALYRFFHYPNSSRLRLGQILVLPPYQKKGYCRFLLNALTEFAHSEDLYDLTIEEPLDSIQYIRTCIDIERLLAFEPIKTALNSTVLRLKHENLSKKSESSYFGPPPSVTEEVRKSLKINKKQFLQCWEVLTYISLIEGGGDKYMENYKTVISDRVRADIIGKECGNRKKVIDIETEFDEEMSFVMFNGPGNPVEENEKGQEEQMRELVEERMRVIESIAAKVSNSN